LILFLYIGGMSYFDIALKPNKLVEIANMTKVLLAAIDVKPAEIVGRGMSGAVAMPIFGMALDASLIIARKESDDSHGGRGMVRPHGMVACDFNNYIVVDDFVDTGATLRKIEGSIKNYCDALGVTYHAPKATVFYCPSAQPAVMALDNCPAIGVNSTMKEVYVKNVSEQQIEKLNQVTEFFGFTLHTS
jgi:hypoxanthine phosphoribosyltransferase